MKIVNREKRQKGKMARLLLPIANLCKLNEQITRLGDIIFNKHKFYKFVQVFA